MQLSTHLRPITPSAPSHLRPETPFKCSPGRSSNHAVSKSAAASMPSQQLLVPPPPSPVHSSGVFTFGGRVGEGYFNGGGGSTLVQPMPQAMPMAQAMPMHPFAVASPAGWDGVRKIGPDVHRRAHSPAKGSPTKGRGAQMAFEAGWME